MSTAAEMQFPEHVNTALWWSGRDFAVSAVVTSKRTVNRNVQLKLKSRLLGRGCLQ